MSNISAARLRALSGFNTIKCAIESNSMGIEERGNIMRYGVQAIEDGINEVVTDKVELSVPSVWAGLPAASILSKSNIYERFELLNSAWRVHAKMGTGYGIEVSNSSFTCFDLALDNFIGIFR